MVGSRSGKNLDRESVRVRPAKAVPDPLSLHLPGESMAAKRALPKAKRRAAKADLRSSPTASTLSMAIGSLINMAAVTTVSGAVLLTLLAIKHF
jgi:hypothetical protein